MTRVRTNNVFGTTTDNPLTAAATTMNSAGLANLAAVTGSDTAIIILDPNRLTGAPEIVIVTAHTGSATSATISRGEFGTTARSHALGTEWVHGPVATVGSDLGDYPERIGARLRRVAAQTFTSGTTANISWDTEDQDTNGFIAVTATTLTIPTGLGGVYSVSVRATWSAAIGARHFLDVVAGGNSWRINGSDNGEDLIGGGVTVALADAATIAILGFQGSGSDKTLTANLEVFRLSP